MYNIEQLLEQKTVSSILISTTAVDHSFNIQKLILLISTIHF